MRLCIATPVSFKDEPSRPFSPSLSNSALCFISTYSYYLLPYACMDPGGVVGVASIAIQLAECIQKLCKFWKAVRDAPANVNVLFDELKTLSLVLSLPRSHLSGTEQAAITDKVILDCQMQMNKLEAKLIKVKVGLEASNLATRKWAAVKKVLKDSDIESLRKSVQQAKETLILFSISSLQYE